MAGIKTLKELYSKLGERELRKLLQKELRITEKFNAYRFSFEKNSKDNTIYYYGKNGKVPLSKIERTLSDIYEGAINHINNLSPEILEKFPSRHRFGFSWFPQNSAQSSQYERRPKSGLILTDVTIRDYQSDVVREIEQISILESWSKLLKVESAKPLFEGHINQDLIDFLIESAKREIDYQPLFESIHLSSHLADSFTDPGNLIFEVEDRLFKIAESNKTVSEKRSHLLDILLMDVLDCLESFNVLSFSSHSSETDEAYIEIVCEMFNHYVKNNGNTYLDLGIKKPEFLEKNGSLNTKWITNESTRKILKSNRDYEYLLGIFLANLRKPKSQSGLLNESLANRFNQKIEEINQVIGNDYSFLEFSTLIKEKEEAIDIQSSEPDYVTAVNILNRFFNDNRTYASGKEKINLIVCNAGFLTHRIKEEAESAFKLNGLKSVIIHAKDLLKKHIGVDESSVERLLSQYVSDNNDLFVDYKIVDYPLFYKVLTVCRPDYEPAIISLNFTPDSFKKEYQSHSIVCSDEDQTLKREIKINYFRDKSKENILKAIEDESYKNYCGLTPQIMHPYWTEIKKSFSNFTYRDI